MAVGLFSLSTTIHNAELKRTLYSHARILYFLKPWLIQRDWTPITVICLMHL